MATVVNRQNLIHDLKSALTKVTAVVTKVEQLLVETGDEVITVEQMDTFMDLGTQMDTAAGELVDCMTDAVWDFADENDDIDLSKYE